MIEHRPQFENQVFRPVPTMGGVLGFVVFLMLVAGIGGGFTYALAEASATVRAMLMIPFFIFALLGFYIVLAFFTIKYSASSESLDLQWGIWKRRIAWSEIQAIERVKGLPKIWPVFGANWPGYCAGAFSISGLGVMTIFGTEIEDNLIVIRSEKGVFAITPAQISSFLEIVQKKTKLFIQNLDLDDMPEAVMQPVPSEDNIYLALAGLNFVSLLGFIAYLVAFFPGAVSAAKSQGIPGPPRELVLLAVISLVLFFVNIGSARKIYQNMAAGSYMLWGIGIFITLFFAALSMYIISFS